MGTLLANSELLTEYPKVSLFVTGVLIPMLNVFLRWITDTAITSFAPLDKYRGLTSDNEDGK